MTMNYEKTAIEIEGKKYRALNTEYRIYVEPWFEGDVKGTVLNVYCDEKKAVSMFSSVPTAIWAMICGSTCLMPS